MLPPSRVFPVGLYGLLLLAVFGLAGQQHIRGLEQGLRSLISLPLRAYSLLGARPVQAAEQPPQLAAPVELLRRQRLTALTGAMSPGPRYMPICVPVVERVRSGNGRFATTELLLDLPATKHADFARYATAGDRLLGFLAVPKGDAAGERLRVHLLHRRQHRSRAQRGKALQVLPRGAELPERVFAELRHQDLPKQLRQDDPRMVLRMLVEPAEPVEDWPLRCTTLNDPYLASRLRRSGAPIWSLAMPLGQGPPLPAGLRLGQLKIWGYPKLGIPVGLFVEPPQDPGTISMVVLWQQQPTQGVVTDDPEWAGRRGRLVPVRRMRLPSRPERWLCTVPGEPVPDGAAVLQAGMLVARMRGGWSGQALATPFALDAQPFAALFLPKNDEPVRELRLVVVGAKGHRVVVQAADGGSLSLPAGHLFTGAEGAACPAGLFLGAVRTDTSGAVWLVRPQLADEEHPVRVFVPEVGQ